MVKTGTSIVFSTKEIANQLTLTVRLKRYREWKIRTWIAIKIITFACWVAWIGIEVKEE